MELVFKCNFCDFMSDRKSVMEHEEQCQKNPAKHSCQTCTNASGISSYKCALGKEIPFGKCMIHCPNYAPGGDPEEKITKSFASMFGDPFGWYSK